MATPGDAKSRMKDEKRAGTVRLLTENIGGKAAASKAGNPNLFVKTLLMVCQEAGAENADTDILDTRVANLLHNELASFSLAVERMELERHVAHVDRAAYERMQREVVLEMQAEAAAVEAHKAELAASRVHLEHQLEYEGLKRLLVQLPRRCETHAQLQRVADDIAGQRVEGRRLDRAQEYRKKQLALLAHVLRDLQSSFADEALLGLPGGEDVDDAAAHAAPEAMETDA